MNGQEAELIVNDYGGAIARGDIRRLSWLPCSKAQIKKAYFAYIEAIIKKTGTLPKEVGDNLVTTYSMMDMFIDDEKADKLEDIKAKIDANELDSKNASDKKLLMEYYAYLTGEQNDDGTFSGGMMDRDLFDEINNYIGKCLSEQNK